MRKGHIVALSFGVSSAQSNRNWGVTRLKLWVLRCFEWNRDECDGGYSLSPSAGERESARARPTELGATENSEEP